MRLWLFLAALNGLLAVAAGAYGAHWLEVTDSAHRDLFNTGMQYHMWHALALLAVAWLASRPEAAGAQDTPTLCIPVGTHCPELSYSHKLWPVE